MKFPADMNDGWIFSQEICRIFVAHELGFNYIELDLGSFASMGFFLIKREVLYLCELCKFNCVWYCEMMIWGGGAVGRRD